MEIEQRSDGDITIVTAIGEFGNPESDELAAELKKLIDSGCRRIVLHMGKVTFICVATAGAMVVSSRRMAESGGELVVAEPGPCGHSMTTIGLDQVFRFFPTEEEAIRHLRREETSST